MNTSTISVVLQKLNGDHETISGSADIYYDEQIYIEDPGYREITAQVWDPKLNHMLETCGEKDWNVEAVGIDNSLGYGRVKDWFNVDADDYTLQVGLYRFRVVYPYDGTADRIVASDGTVARIF